jgi:cytochrome b561
MPDAPLRTRYDNVQVTLHWLTVLIVLHQFISSLIWSQFARPTRHEMIVLHMSFGTLLGLIVMARFVWRFMPGHRVAPAIGGWQERASMLVHYGLYAMLAVQFLLGFILRWSGREDMNVFGLLLPSPFETRVSRPLHQQIGEVHEWLGYAIVATAAGHAVMALYHQFIARDGVLTRMLPHRGRA